MTYPHDQEFTKFLMADYFYSRPLGADDLKLFRSGERDWVSALNHNESTWFYGRHGVVLPDVALGLCYVGAHNHRKANPHLNHALKWSFGVACGYVLAQAQIAGIPVQGLSDGYRVTSLYFPIPYRKSIVNAITAADSLLDDWWRQQSIIKKMLGSTYPENNHPVVQKATEEVAAILRI
jgi:hypothetical protein